MVDQYPAQTGGLTGGTTATSSGQRPAQSPWTQQQSQHLNTMGQYDPSSQQMLLDQRRGIRGPSWQNSEQSAVNQGVQGLQSFAGGMTGLYDGGQSTSYNWMDPLTSLIQSQSAGQLAGFNQQFAGVDALEQLAQQMYGLGQRGLQADHANAGAGIGIRRDYLGKERGFNSRNLGLDTQDVGLNKGLLNLRHGEAQRMRRSDATACGATVSRGNRDAKGFLENELGLQLSQQDVQQGRAQLGYDQTGARINRDDGLLGVEDQQRQQALSLGMEKLGIDRDSDLAKLMIQGGKLSGDEGAFLKSMQDSLLSLGGYMTNLPPELQRKMTEWTQNNHELLTGNDLTPPPDTSAISQSVSSGALADQLAGLGGAT